MTPSRLLRYAYLAGFFVALPLAAAALVVWAVAPGDGYVGTGALGWVLSVFRDQRVPVAIVLFTVFEVVLWNRRHALPFSEILGADRRGDVPARYRAEFERAAALLDEAERIQRREGRRIERDRTPDEREILAVSLDELRDAMRADPFRGDEFGRALIRAETEVDAKLGRWRKGELREYAESIGFAVFVALLLRIFVVEAFKIPSGSMIPTLQIGDHIFVNKMSYGALIPFTKTRLFPRMPPKRGDVIVFEFPENREQDFIKRTIATPGDRLEVKDGHPILNGWKVPYCSVGTYTYREPDGGIARKAELDVEYLEDKAYLTQYDRTSMSFAGEVQGPYFAKPGEVWVLGDNRNNSHDSRGWFEGKGGGVPFENIKGRAMFVWLSVEGGGHWAWDRIGVSVMGRPKLTPAMAPTLQAGLDKCFAERPPLTQTTPPPPAPLDRTFVLVRPNALHTSGRVFRADRRDRRSTVRSTTKRGLQPHACFDVGNGIHRPRPRLGLQEEQRRGDGRGRQRVADHDQRHRSERSAGDRDRAGRPHPLQRRGTRDRHGVHQGRRRRPQRGRPDVDDPRAPRPQRRGQQEGAPRPVLPRRLSGRSRAAQAGLDRSGRGHRHPGRRDHDDDAPADQHGRAADQHGRTARDDDRGAPAHPHPGQALTRSTRPPVVLSHRTMARPR